MANLKYHILNVLAALALSVGGAANAMDLANPEEFQKVVTADTNALPELTAALNGPRPDLAVKALGTMKLTQALPLLALVATNADGELRADAAWALGECGGPAAVGELTGLAQDSYPPAREAALTAIARLGGTPAETAIRAALKDSSRPIRLAAARAVGQSGRKEWFASLLPLLQWHAEMRADPADKNAAPRQIECVVWSEPSEQVRLAAIQSLGKLKVLDSVPVLIEAMEREDAYNRLAIIGVIRSLGESAAGPCLGRIVPIPCDQETIQKYLPVLVNNGTLAVIAGQMNDDRCVPYLLETLKLPWEKLGTDKTLTELYIQTIERLGHFKVEKAARPLVHLMKETSLSQVADACAESLREIGHAAARPIARNLDNWQMVPAFAALLREKNLQTAAARDSLVGYLTHESADVRLAAVETLGLYIYDGVLEEYDVALLDAMYLDPSPEIRARSAYWTARIRAKIDKGGAP